MNRFDALVAIVRAAPPGARGWIAAMAVTTIGLPAIAASCLAVAHLLR